jgi:phosphoglycerate dehydrogenase-like enzyme
MKIVIDLDGIAKYYSLPEETLQKLKSDLPEHEFSRLQETANPNNADVWVCWNLKPEVFSKLTNLKLVIYATDGMGKHRLYPEIISSDVQICNSRGCRSQAIAEHTFMLILACAKKLRPMIESVDKDGWWGMKVVSEPRKPFSLEGKTIGILGLGEIGSRIAKIGKNGFGMKVFGLRRNPKPTDNVDQVFGMDELPQLLSQSDIIAVALPDTDATSHLLDGEMMNSIKNGAILVNISRGNIIGTQSLIDAIKSGKIASAGLDVFETEPLPPDSPLRSVKELVLTPHAAGSSADFWPCFGNIISKNVSNLAAGKPLANIVDKLIGY